MVAYNEEFDKLPTPYQSLDADGHIRHVNSEWLNLLGYSYDEVVERSFLDFIPTEQKVLFPMHFASFKEAGKISGMEYIVLHKDGHAIPVRHNGKIEKCEGTLQTRCIIEDISKEKTTENLYQELFKYSHSGVVIYQAIDDGEDFEILDLNPRVEEIEKISRNAIIGKRVTEVFTGIKDTLIFKAFQESYKSGKTVETPPTLYRDEQRVGFRTNIITKLPNNQLYVVYNDETELEFSKRLLNTTLDTINSIICTTIDGEHLYSCNSYFLKVFGYRDIEEFKKEHQCICDFFIEDRERGYIGEYIDGIRWTRYAIEKSCDNPIKTKMRINNQERIYALHIERLFLDEKNRYLVVLDDITLQEEYEHSLKDEIAKQTDNIRHLHKLLLESEKISQSGVVEIELHSQTETWSDGLYALLGDDAHATEPSPENGLYFIHPEDREMVKNHIIEGIDCKHFEEIECRIVTLNEEEKYINIVGHFLNENGGKADRLIMVISDKTSEKMLERLDEEHQKLQIRHHHLNSLKQMFVNIAHHWRQPLNVISTASQSLLDHFEDATLTQKKLEDVVHIIKRESQYLSQTINNFSELANENKMRRTLNLKQKINTILNLHKPNLDMHNIKTTTDLDELTIESIPNELSRVLYSLLENSIESIAKRKEKSPDMDGKIDISLKKSGGFVKISIKDNGVGISDAVKEKIFEPYFTTKFQSRGVGLSLSIDRHIITTLFKGEITINNHIKEGVEFIIEFPYE